MSIESRKLRAGLRHRYSKMVRGKRLQSPFIYLSKKRALEAEAEAVHVYLTEGRVMIPPAEDQPQETVLELYARWIKWLKLHRSPGYASRMESLMARAVTIAPDLADLPANLLTEAQVESWGERWAADLLGRGKGLQTINDWLRYSQTAWNEPWGRKRARRLRPENPFEYVDRYSIERKAKYVPTHEEVAKIKMAASPEFRLWLEVVTETAARVGEARQLAWEDVELDRPGVILYTRKTAMGDRIPRRLPITPQLKRRFLSWRRSQGQGKVFVFQQEEQAAPRHDIWIRKNLAAACAQAKVKYFPPGCFRHYRASAWAAEGKPLTQIRDWLGHSKATTTDNYLHQIGASA